LKKAIVEKDLSTAKRLTVDLQALLRPTGHTIRLIESKNRLYELAIDLGEIEFAKTGLESNRKATNKNTRTNLEATALLAICLLRENKIEEAKPLIKEVLKNDKVIKSNRTRALFRKEIIDRFNEEITLCSLKEEPIQNFNEDDLEPEITKLLQTSNNDQLFLAVGKATPEYTKYNLLQVHQYSTNQLPSAERMALPSPEEKGEPKEVGRTVFKSVKRVIYRSLCDPNSDIYKTWYNNGMQMVLNKKFIHTAVITTLATFGIGIKLLAASIVALIIKFGIEVYCDKNKPLNMMELRGK
jgi:hypothetical protein